GDREQVKRSEIGDQRRPGPDFGGALAEPDLAAQDLSQAGPVCVCRDGCEAVAEVGEAIAAGLEAIEPVRDEITIKFGLGRGIGWLNQPGELVAERDIVLAAFATRSETSI